MGINRNNYEAYLLDLLEGRLSAEVQQQLRDFLLLNPDCSTGIGELEPWILEKHKISFPDHDCLKKELPGPSALLTAYNFDLFSIARMEGDLTPEQEIDHAGMVEGNDQLQKDWSLWQQTKLIPEPIVFKHKKNLKRRIGIDRRVVWMTIVSSAAAIALIISLVRIDRSVPENELAGREIADPPSMEEPAILADDPVALQEEQQEIAEEVATILADQPVLFSIRRDPERQAAESKERGKNDSGAVADSVKQAREESLRSDPVRIASNMPAHPEPLNRMSYDLIQPLEIPPASVHLTSLSITQLAEIELQELFNEYTKENNISLWTIANAGFKGINWLTGTDMSLMANRDEDGDVSGVQFKSRRFTFATPIDRSE